jgi:thiamine-phosphate pyrophosphorylase
MARIDFRLYLITDRNQTGGRPLSGVVKEAASAGLQAVQLREKDLPARALLSLAEELRALTREHGARLFINGRIDIALAVGADGVHLPADGLPVGVVRRIIGGKMLLGVSCHSAEEAAAAEREGADFAVLGPIFPTPSKAGFGPPLGLETLEKASKATSIPIFAVGGVKRERIEPLLQAGAFGVAMISALLGAENVERTTRGIRDEINRCNIFRG